MAAWREGRDRSAPVHGSYNNESTLRAAPQSIINAILDVGRLCQNILSGQDVSQ
jgi:hypothetical protein